MSARCVQSLIAALLLLVFACATTAAEPLSQPNVLIIMADDCTFSELPAYGGVNAHAPNIDRLADEGLLFERAYLSSAMCQPCRAELYSGRYPLRNGCAWNHSASRPGLKTMPHYLSEAGYRVGLAGKVHLKPASVFPFERVTGFDGNCVRNPTRPHECASIAEFMQRDAEQPFCLVVALVEPHVPWVMGDASRYPPEEIELPPNIADTERTRQDFGRYLAEITYMDGQVGEILQTVDDSGARDSTLVLFTSEQGSQFPGCKWTNWDTGLHTALIARWPSVTPAGERTAALVQYADVLPTLLAAADADVPADLDGSSFLPVLRGEGDEHREFAYGMHNNVPEGPPYPIRSITDGTYRYVRNLRPNLLYIEKHLMGASGDGSLNNPYWGTWIWDSTTSERSRALVSRYMQRPAEQLYHTAADPYELENLAESEGLAEHRNHLRDELARWMASQGDPGAPQDTWKSLEAARQGKHRFVPPDESE